MVSVAYYCTAGYTETGGMQAFLEKIHPDISFRRCFPTTDKPNPKLGRTYPAPQKEQCGTSGNALINDMLKRLEAFPPQEDCILLIDDADCTYKNRDEFEQHANDIAQQVHGKIKNSTFLFLLAAPEIELWFVADWSNAFAKVYKNKHKALQHALSTYLPTELEDFGQPQKKHEGCTVKLSELIRDELLNIPDPEMYSKRIHGASMLQKIIPETVAAKCSKYFALTYMALKDLPKQSTTTN